MVLNLVFVNNIILSCLLFFLVDSYFQISAVAAQIFNPSAELGMSIGILSNEAKPEIETHPVTAEAKINKYLI